MKTIKKDELFRGVSDFLKTKGVELKDGAYAQRIKRAFDLLTTAVNSTHKTVKHVEVKVDKKLGELRQTIHEATAPKQPPVAPALAKSIRGKGKKTLRKRSKPSSVTRKSPRRK